MIVQQLHRWQRLGLSGFWAQRAAFYRIIAKSMQRRELLKDFVEGEYEIAMAPATRNPARAAGLKYMRDLIQGGVTTLAEVLIATMPATDGMALSTLRQSPDPIKSLIYLADNIDEQTKMKKVVMSAVITPIFLIPIGLGFSYMIATTTIPAFVEAAPPEIWTGFNKLYRNTAEGFQQWGLWVVTGLLLTLSWLFIYGLPNITASWRYRAEKAVGLSRFGWTLIFPLRPALQIYRDIQGTRMMTDLAFMLQSGRLIGDAVETLATHAQPWMRRHLMVILDHMHQMPGHYVGAFSHGILSPHLAGTMQSLNRVDTESRFDRVLIEIGTVGAEEARDAVKAAAIKLNIILLTCIMGVILFFYGGQMVVIKSIEEANSPASIMKREAAKRRNAVPLPSSIQE